MTYYLPCLFIRRICISYGVNFCQKIYYILYLVRHIECPTLKLEGGTVSKTGKLPGSIAVHECKENSTLVGMVLRTCTEDSSWTGSAPKCQRMFDYFRYL